MKIRNILLLWFAFLCISVAFAQEKVPPQPTKDSGDAPPIGLPLPIDDYILLLMPVGLILGICFLGFSQNAKNGLPEDA
ncbi:MULTISPECIES: hypothetical protein [unclassified Leeuwenhoekiella]|nr:MULTISPECIES: hypothetical protein [unclassified Leeuwenhoekiella]|tara:strand:+ start:8996 stop:9232 length:237 start_codon:yes stop_codon:yes gene_type:complete